MCTFKSFTSTTVLYLGQENKTARYAWWIVLKFPFSSEQNFEQRSNEEQGLLKAMKIGSAMNGQVADLTQANAPH